MKNDTLKSMVIFDFLLIKGLNNFRVPRQISFTNVENQAE